MDLTYTQIVEIAYKLSQPMADGIYQAIISDLLFDFKDGTSIEETQLPVQITVDNSLTGLSKTFAETNVYLYKGRLYVNSPAAETIHVYSVNGVLLCNFRKSAGLAEYSIDKVSTSVLIVKGSSGWVKKVIR